MGEWCGHGCYLKCFRNDAQKSGPSTELEVILASGSKGGSWGQGMKPTQMLPLPQLLPPGHGQWPRGSISNAASPQAGQAVIWMGHCLGCVYNVFQPSLCPHPKGYHPAVAFSWQLASGLPWARHGRQRTKRLWPLQGVPTAVSLHQTLSFSPSAVSSSSQLPPGRTGEGLVLSLWRKPEPSSGSPEAGNRAGMVPKDGSLPGRWLPLPCLYLLELPYLLEGQESQLNTTVVLWDA